MPYFDMIMSCTVCLTWWGSARGIIYSFPLRFWPGGWGRGAPGELFCLQSYQRKAPPLEAQRHLKSEREQRSPLISCVMYSGKLSGFIPPAEVRNVCGSAGVTL